MHYSNTLAGYIEKYGEVEGKKKYKKAKDMIKYFYKHRDKLQTIDKKIDFYDQKI